MRAYRSSTALALAFAFALTLVAFAQTRSDPPADLDAYVARVMKTFEVPGIAVAIVKDGKVVVAKGYGVRKLGEPAPVDAQTLFGIASNTKVFTADGARPAGRGGQDRVGRAGRPLPAVVPDVGSVRHARADGARPARAPQRPRPGRRRSALVAGLDLRPQGDRAPAALHPPATSFRSAYAYDNVLYLVAGEVIEALSGQSWEDFVPARILEDGRHDDEQRAALATPRSGGNVATTHAPVDGKVRADRPFDSDNTNPAGGINSNAETWRSGCACSSRAASSPDGSRLFSDATWRQLTTLVTPMPIDAAAAGARRRSGRTSAATRSASSVRDYRGPQAADAHRRAARATCRGW